MSIERRGKHFSVRLGRKRLGTFKTVEEARLAEKGGDLAAYWEEWLPRRRNSGVRDVAREEQRWELYLAAEAVTSVPLRSLSKRDARQWFGKMQARGLKPQTVRNALNLVRVVCASAVQDELLDVNPFDGLRVHRSANARSEEGFTVLDPEEQLNLLGAVDQDQVHMVAFALHTGMRSSELWSLRTADIDLDAQEVAVRYSRKDLPPKGGKIRRVPLFGAGLDAARWAVQQGKEFAFPSPRTGERRYPSSQPHHWHKWIGAAGIKRRVRFYDLRHTCATALLAGWWGRKWAIDEVRQMLGHSTVKITERYAHLVDDTLRKAGRETAGVGRPRTGDPDGATYRIWTDDLRFTKTCGLESFQALAIERLWERADAETAGVRADIRELTRLAKARPRDGFERAEPVLRRLAGRVS